MSLSCRHWRLVALVVLGLLQPAAARAGALDIEHTVAAERRALLQQLRALETAVAAADDRLRSLENESDAVDPWEGGGGCGDCCGVVSCGWGQDFYLGATAIWARPFIESAQPLVLRDASGADTSLTFDYDYELTPRIWIGSQFCPGWGVRGSYWQYDHDIADSAADPGPGSVLSTVNSLAGTFTVSAGSPGDTMLVEHSLEMQILDLDVTCQFANCFCWGLFSAGLRYGRIDQQFVATELTAAGMVDGRLRYVHNFEGVGPTLALDAWFPLGCSGWMFYTTARGSVLFGEAGEDLALERPPRDAFLFQRSDGDATQAISELQLGLQYARACWTARAGWETQIWHNAGGPTDFRHDLGLQGFAVSLGVHR